MNLCTPSGLEKKPDGEFIETTYNCEKFYN